MADKKNVPFIQPDDLGNAFEDDDFILNYRPNIEFIEPDQVGAPHLDFPGPDDSSIDDFRQQTQDLIDGYRAASDLADLAQKRIDNRVNQSGGVRIKLDPVKDAPTIAAMKRKFPDKDPTVLDYECYKMCLEEVSQAGPQIPEVTQDDIQAAKADPSRVDFGGWGNRSGENRAEIASPANSVDPVDLSAFQAAGIVALFGLMLPLIKQSEQQAIAQHLVTAPHKPV